MRRRDYVPTRESEMAAWLAGLVHRLAADPAAFGLSDERVAVLVAKHDAFVAAYRLASSPMTRTTPVVRGKNDAKRAVLAEVRSVVATVQAWPGTTDEQRVNLGITVRTPADERVKSVRVPSERPRVMVREVGRRHVVVAVRRDDGTGHKDKPAGVRAAWLYTFVGERPPASLDGFRFAGGTTRSEARVDLGPDVPAGAKVWVAAAWVNSRDVPGPVCPPVSAWTTHGLLSGRGGGGGGCGRGGAPRGGGGGGGGGGRG